MKSTLFLATVLIVVACVASFQFQCNNPSVPSVPSVTGGLRPQRSPRSPNRWRQVPAGAVYATAKGKGSGDDNTNKPEKEANKKPLTLSGIAQLVGFGVGAPVLGEYKGTDPATGKMFFELEANNLVDAEGKDVQMKGKFFKDGWVEGSTESIDPPGFFQNLLSGGKLMAEWDSKNRKSK